ncbi:Holliday junction resolvase [Desulfotomaculum nigrificans CO-1-SRB]|uniref:Putative pre-16S rRNA nuclease n=1 Tax=Desulfotomaculum nigrificans (strain DSM 14880 / VKM B-2319 / CO-1-SRB) TaxID=868595 RepID=F6B2V7_DESCC|nr:Holliday junction resolvase RuvX [Desulfotomaculum nigrificans]AEF95065.1 Holliday junction resolvase [Desulfotomaculum nigrificans CO-1-SRB]
MRVMGLDVGDKTIGVALSDPLGWTAQALEVIRRGDNLDKDLNRLAEIVQEYQVEQILVGLPKNMNGTLGPQGEKVLAFIERLKERIDLPVKTWDERLSTVAAERALLEADVSRSKRKKVIDKMAAAVILQGYLDSGAIKG